MLIDKKLTYLIFCILLVLIASFFADFYQIKFFSASLNPPAFSEVEIETQDFIPDELLEEEPDKIPEEHLGGGIQEQLDDIAEKIDIIRSQVTEIELQTRPVIQEVALLNNEANPNDENLKLDEQEFKEEIKLAVQPVNQNIVSMGGGKPIYPKILISEVQTAGQDDEKQEFIELQNPNNFSVDLTGWYLQKKTAGGLSWSTYAPSRLFSDKSIPAFGYFLIAREGYYPGTADIFTDGSITNDNSFALKDPNGDISDKLGFGNAIDPELLPTVSPGAGQSIGRKVLSDGAEEETDNNSFDFELQTPTPKSKNTAYVAPDVAEPAEPELENILINEIQVSPIGQRFVELYNKNSTNVDLTGWYLQRKTEADSDFSSFVTSPNFEEKIILAKEYFLISRGLENSDILSEIALNDNDFLALKNSDGDIIDEISWAESPDAGKSLGRKLDESIFEMNTPTPRAKNIAWVEPLPLALVSIETTTPPAKLIFNVGDLLDIIGLGVSGIYSDGSKKVEEVTKENISGFDSSAPVIGQILTITVNGKTATYTIDINEVSDENLPSIITYTISNQIISPDGDGNDDSTDIDLEFSEKVDYKIYIKSGDTVVNEWSGQATNPRAKIWDGKDSFGAVVPAGVYTVEIFIEDSDKNSITDTSKTITIVF